jgi:hypothetical protein
VRPNDKYTPLPRGPWRGVPMNSVRLQTIWLNKEPKPHLSSKGNKE